MRGEKIDEYDIEVTGLTESGVRLDAILSGQAVIPSQGLRIDVAFDGRVTGQARGSGARDRPRADAGRRPDRPRQPSPMDTSPLLDARRRGRVTRPRWLPLPSAALLLALAGCAGAERPITTASGLVYTVVTQGSGPVARAGQHVLIHETTTRPDGQVQFSTRTRGRPLRFLLGASQVIDGVDEGVTGMRVGERRKLIVPPALSRRTTYPEGLSPDDTLVYDVELVGIEPQ